MAVPLGIGYAGSKSDKKNAPAPPDYQGLARETADLQHGLLQEQTRANRPNQSTPYASSTWAQGPDGSWTQGVQFNGPLAGMNQSLMQQAADATSSPLDFSGIPGLTNGDAARDQAINAAYGQATSRLDPQWQQREDQLRARLMGQGLTEGSAAWDKAMNSLGQQRNDAYTSAMNSAIGQGTEAGSALFNQSLAARQQGVAEALRRRGQAFGELQQMQGLTQMPGFSQAGMSEAPNLLGAGGMQDAANFRNYQNHQQQVNDFYNTLFNLFGKGGAMMAGGGF
jgi:hypothetical protein